MSMDDVNDVKKEDQELGEGQGAPIVEEGAAPGEVLPETPPPSHEEFAMELDYFEDDKQEDKLWQARTGLNPDTLCGAIETIIFMSERPVTLMKIKAMIDPDMPLRVLHESIARLQEDYEKAHHGIRLREVAEGYQFRTKATYSKYVQDIFKVSSLVLGPTALEVLAIIAYKQPVSKTEIDKIRGVDSSHIIRALMDRRLVRATGRADDIGRPTLYGTTPEFLEVFNLGSLSDLPPEHELESMARTNVGKISDIKGLVASGEKGQFNFDEWAELDQLSESIKSIASETDFTRSLEEEDKRRKEAQAQGIPIKSAFDLLEEYVVRTQMAAQNKLASQSQPFVLGEEARVVSDLEAGPFNVPLPEEEFEMIDLETGGPIRTEKAESILDFEDDLEGQRQTLEEALDRALNERFKDELDELSLATELEEKVSALEAPIEEMIQKGSELGLDIQFMKDVPEILKEIERDAEQDKELDPN